MEYYEFKKEDAYEFVRVSGIQSKQRGDELQLLFCPYCRGGKNGDKDIAVAVCSGGVSEHC